MTDDPGDFGEALGLLPDAKKLFRAIKELVPDGVDHWGLVMLREADGDGEIPSFVALSTDRKVVAVHALRWAADILGVEVPEGIPEIEKVTRVHLGTPPRD